MGLPEIALATANDFGIESFDVGLQKIQRFDFLRLKQLRNGLAFDFGACEQPAIIFHAPHFNDASERFEQGTGSGEIVATKNVLARAPADGFFDADFFVITVAGSRATFRIYLDNRKRLQKFSGQQKIRVADASEVHDGEI